ncbi:molybdopterin-guanine dinucleotide biosynthesis protein MobB [Helicobacter pylori]|uniref:molybdopterin-guanine dinucleotide biosynthesis protein MobB n=1 Tax=Helicobacter pylori TaxID=210 RepID=UPI0019349F27|nr:molybdopterin-guanine dinucleotide biosynthesis protein MobB [Helicobacter pylori]
MMNDLLNKDLLNKNLENIARTKIQAEKEIQEKYQQLLTQHQELHNLSYKSLETWNNNYTDTLNTNNATIKNYINLLQKTQESLKNSYLELETANKEHNKTMQTKLQELEKHIHKNLAKKTLIPILTFTGGVVIMGAILVGAYFLIILPSKDKELELSQKEVFQLKREIDQLNNANLQRIYNQIPTKK